MKRPLSNKKIRYSAHLEARLEFRGIAKDVPTRILKESDQFFRDTATGYSIAIAKVPYRGGAHLMMAAFEEEEHEVVIITVHPLDESDLKKKIKNGRWNS